MEDYAFGVNLFEDRVKELGTVFIGGFSWHRRIQM